MKDPHECKINTIMNFHNIQQRNTLSQDAIGYNNIPGAIYHHNRGGNIPKQQPTPRPNMVTQTPPLPSCGNFTTITTS